jgi:hypothetical protein
MSNENDLKDIAINYSRKTDFEIIHIATQNAKGLRPGVFEIIEKELIKRNLDLNVLNGIIAQNKTYTFEEVEELSLKIRELACPICGSKTSKLNGTIMHTVKSFIYFSSFRKDPIIGCPDCLDKKNIDSIKSTLIFGWWGLPEGLLKTPFYIYANLKSKKQNRDKESNEALISFTHQNIGQIESYKNDNEKLMQILKKLNK